MSNPKEALTIFAILALLMAAVSYFIAGWDGVKQGLITLVAIPILGFIGFGGALLFHFGKDIEVTWKRLATKTFGVSLVLLAIVFALTVFKAVPVNCYTPGCRYD